MTRYEPDVIRPMLSVNVLAWGGGKGITAQFTMVPIGCRVESKVNEFNELADSVGVGAVQSNGCEKVMLTASFVVGLAGEKEIDCPATSLLQSNRTHATPSFVGKGISVPSFGDLKDVQLELFVAMRVQVGPNA